MDWIYPIVLLGSVLLSLFSVRYLKGWMLGFGIAGVDINKAERPRIPEAGGILLLPGIWIITLLLVFSGTINPIAYVFLFTITCFAAVGFFDDGFRLFKKETGWARYVANRGIVLFLFTLPFGYLLLPGVEGVAGPFLYAMMLLFGALVLATSSFTNSFAGLNGWEVGSSAIVIAGLTVMAGFSGIYTGTLVALCLIMIGSFAALFYFNRYPARVFPGDSGTLLAGAFIGCMIPFLEHWYIALALFYPHIYDLILKFRTNRRDMSQKRERPYVLKDGKLEIPKSSKMDFAKLLIRYLGPMKEEELSRRILRIVVSNTLFWTLLYILLEII